MWDNIRARAKHPVPSESEINSTRFTFSFFSLVCLKSQKEGRGSAG
jgi:hypothetical protein